MNAVSHRIVGASSRRPGPDRLETVTVRRARIVDCEACGAPRLDLAGPHGTQLRDIEGRRAVIDCAGREVA